MARELERYASNISKDVATLEDARLIRSEVDRCRVILERMSAQGAQPMGETPERVQLLHFLTQVRGQFPEMDRDLLHIDVSDESLAAVLPVQAMTQSLLALIQNALDANVDRRPVHIGARKTGTDANEFPCRIGA